jgi:hypothetical protein
MLLAVLLEPLLTPDCMAQPDSAAQKPVRVILKDGSELIGTIVGEDSVSIEFKTIGNIAMTIPRGQIKTLERLGGRITDGVYVRSDPNGTRLFFGPTARSLKAGQGYLSVYELFFPMLGVGIADVVTFAGGMSLFPGALNQMIYVAPKVTPIQIADFGVAGGLLYINSTGGGTDGAGLYYGLATYGGQNASLTLGLGWGFFGSDVADEPIVMIGGELRISNSVRLITENWIPPNSDIVLASFGFRFYGEALAADLAFVRPVGSRFSGFPFVPWIGFAYNFGVAR